MPLVVAGVGLRFVETDAGERVPDRGERDRPRATIAVQCGPEQVGEHIMPEVVRGQLGLPTGSDPRLRAAGGRDDGGTRTDEGRDGLDAEPGASAVTMASVPLRSMPATTSMAVVRVPNPELPAGRRS